jgi:hypothetical protein
MQQVCLYLIPEQRGTTTSWEKDKEESKTRILEDKP